MSLALRAGLVALLAAGALGAQQDDYRPRYKLSEGREVVAVYVGAESCGPCHLPEVKAAVREMKNKVALQASRQQASYSIVGVANDWHVETGAAFLKDLGTFDQVVLGGNWTNLAIDHYLLRDTTGVLALPQIVIFERTVSLANPRRVAISEPRLLRRVTGGKEIPEWNAAGAPISPEEPKRP